MKDEDRSMDNLDDLIHLPLIGTFLDDKKKVNGMRYVDSQ